MSFGFAEPRIVAEKENRRIFGPDVRFRENLVDMQEVLVLLVNPSVESPDVGLVVAQNIIRAGR
ncbi:MAG TPA: hypothetical protein VKD90_11085 [Gemmataceae bacterium]|nr:hypothetical protein [Gemmataceae bacterium]